MRLIRKQFDLGITDLHTSSVLVASDGDWEAPEIQISGSQDALVALGRLLSDARGDCAIELDVRDGGVYQVSIPKIFIHVISQGDALLGVHADTTSLNFSGDNDAFRKLGQSLINFFGGDVEIGQHFQLDYYPGNQLLQKTNCHLIFLCE